LPSLKLRTSRNTSSKQYHYTIFLTLTNTLQIFHFTICIFSIVVLSMAILKCSVFADILCGTPSHYTEEGRLSKVEGVQYVSKFDVLSRSFAQYAIDGTLHHPAPVARKKSTPISQPLKNTKPK
jgi:hypothetical protein